MSKVSAKLKEEFFKILPPTIYFFVTLHIHELARDREGKGAADILWTNARSASLSEAAWVRFSSSFVLVLVVGH